MPGQSVREFPDRPHQKVQRGDRSFWAGLLDVPGPRKRSGARASRTACTDNLLLPLTREQPGSGQVWKDINEFRPSAFLADKR